MTKRLYTAVLLLLALPASAEYVAAADRPLDDVFEQVAQLRPQDLQADPLSAIGTGPIIVVFADSEDDPLLARQLAELGEEVEALEERGVVLLVDAKPEGEGPLRQKLHPSGFRIVLLDLDGDVVRRRPIVTEADWLIRQIDEMPSARRR